MYKLGGEKDFNVDLTNNCIDCSPDLRGAN